MGALSAPRPALPPFRLAPGFWGRAAAAALVVAAAGWLATSLNRPDDHRPHFRIGQDVDRVIAAARATRVPRDAGEELRAIDRRLAFYGARAEGDWMAWEALSGLHSARAQLTGDYRDYRAAEQALDHAFAIARPGSGPHLARVQFNLSVHRIGAVAADLATVRRYRVRTDISEAALLGIEGETAFYSGRPGEALAAWQRADAAERSLGSALRLALYWSRMGDQAQAGRWLDSAEASISGAQPASRSFVERSRGLFALRHGDAREARRHLVTANRLFPGHWANLYFLGLALAMDGEADRALGLLEQVGARMRSPEAMDAAAILYRMRGDGDASRLWAGRAEAIWRERTRLFPEAAAAHRLDHLLAFGSPAEALQVARTAFAARPFAESRIGLAWALIANNHPEAALAALAPVRGSGWSSAELHLAAGRALALLGRGEEAEAEQRAVESINPHLGDRNLAMILVDH
jgi:hypothetical protein